MIFGRVKKSIAILIAFALVITIMPQQSLAKVIYLPDVTSDMSAASYWSDKMDDPERRSSRWMI